MLAAESRWTTHYLQLCRVHSAPQNGHREWEWREWKHTVTHVKRAKSTQAIMSFGSRWINAKYEHSACPTHFHRLSHSHSTECIQKRQRPATVRDRIQGTRRKRRESVNVFHIFIFLFFFLSLLLLVLGLYISLSLSLFRLLCTAAYCDISLFELTTCFSTPAPFMSSRHESGRTDECIQWLADNKAHKGC